MTTLQIKNESQEEVATVVQIAHERGENQQLWSLNNEGKNEMVMMLALN